MSYPLGTIEVVEQPEAEPVTVAEMREHCRIDHNDDNTYLASLITAARQHVEAATGKIIGEQTLRQKHDCFPCGAIQIQRSPVSEVEVSYTDGSGDSQTMDEDDIQTQLDGSIPLVAPAPGTNWPSTQRDRIGAVTITITGGYETCPDMLKHAIKMLAAHWYANREAVADKSMSEIPFTVEALIATHISPLII